MVQVRKTRTEQAIRQAFIRLVQEKGFNNLSVSDISREAHINRGTFYSHYVDKYNMFDHYVKNVTDEISEIVLKNEESSLLDPAELISYTRILRAMHYIKEQHEFISALAQCAGDGQLQSRMKEIIASLLEHQIAATDNLTLSFHGLPEDYGREMLVSSATAVIWLWIKKDCLESPEEIAHIIDSARNFSPVDLIG